MQQKPSIGRIVRYVDDDGEEFPAIILRVANDGTVSLKIMTESGDYALSGVPHNESRDESERQTWHWPPRD